MYGFVSGKKGTGVGGNRNCAQFCTVSKARKKINLWFLFVIEFFNLKKSQENLKLCTLTMF